MSKEIENKVASTKEEQKGMLSGALLKLVLSGHNKSPEEFAQKAIDLGSSMLNFMKAADLVTADMKIAAEEGIVLNEKGEAVMMVPVEKPRKRKPIKKIAVTEKNFLGLWNDIMSQLKYYEDGTCYMPDVKERIKEVMTKFADDNNL